MPFFSATRRTGQMVYVSGQMPFDAQGQITGVGVAEQTRICLERIDALLQGEGLGLGDVVKTTVWLSRVEDFTAFNESYAQVFMARQMRAPSRSTVRADLMVPGALVEIEAVAQCPAVEEQK